MQKYGIKMDLVDRVWHELKQSGYSWSAAPPNCSRSLSSFQFPKVKKNELSQEKATSVHQRSAVPPQKPADELISHRESAEAQDESLAAQSPGSRTAYGLECWKSVSCTVQRQANVLKEECSSSRRYNALEALKRVFVDASVPSIFYKRAFALLLDPMLLCLSEPAEKARLLSASILFKFFCEAPAVDEALGEVLRALTARFGSEDIERVAHLPPVMRPDPEYKPLQLTPIEQSDEMRQSLFKLLQLVLHRSSDEAVLSHLDLAVGLLRAGAMDVCPEVKCLALEAVVEFCSRHQNMLLHFTEPLARSLLSCLVHQHSRIRMRALRALTLVLSCGLYKYNGEIVHMLAGWRDPNIVPIKSLYEVTTIRNYFAELLADRSPLVRMFFFDTVGYWLLNLQDKADYETWLFPYLLSGLFDSFRPIQQLVFLLLEQLGRHYEQLHEKDLREIKQLGTPDLWSYGGKAFLSFPLGGCWAVSGAAKAREEAQQFAAFVSSYTERLQSLGIEGFSLVEKKQNQLTVPGEELVGDPPRPCLGARTMVRIYFRRFAKTLFQSVSDFKEVSQTASARLLVVSFAFIEEAAVEWLDSCFAICCRVLAAPQQHATAAVESHRVALQLLGAFADPENYWEVAKEALRENVLQELQVQVATLSSLALMLQGSFMVLKKAADPSLGLGRLGPVLPEIAQALSSSHLLQEPYLRFAAEGLTQLVQVLVSGVRGQNETLSEETWHHLLSVTCCLAAPPRCLEGAENSQLQPQLQQLMTDLACCRKATRRMPQPHSDAATLWASVDILRGIPPANLAALSTYIIHLPSCRLLEEKTFQVLFGKLQQCAAATEEAATRRSCRRAALRLVMRLAQLGAASSSSSTDAGTQMPQQKCPAASPTAVSHPSSSGVAGTAVATTAAADSSSGAELQNGEDEESEPVRKLLDCPVAAAAGVLQQLLLRLLQQVECAEDAQDALAALTELLTLPGLDNVNWGEAVQQLLLLSGLSQDLARFLGCPFLHTKLFRSACINYAHHSAATYPDKNPGAVLEEMPLGKRRELRLAALRAAAELKQQAVLLLRLCLPMLAEDRNSLSALVYGTFAALQPPSKLQKRPDACKMGCCDAAKEHGGTAANAAADGAAGTAADGAAGTPADAAADGAARAAADVAGDTAAGNVADAAADAAEDAHAGAVAAAAADSAAEAPANAAAEAAAGGAATAAADSAADIAAGRSSDTDNQPNANEIERTNEEEAEGKEEVCSFAQCTVSLPFEAQSPWLLFQIASCLFDTISLWIVPERGLPNEEEGLRKSKQVFEMCSPDSLLMPRLLALPMYSHLERLHANRRLLELLSESCLCQAVDSCVRQILDLKGSFSEGFEAYLEAPEGPPGAPSGAPKTLKEAVAAAKKQAAAVSLETQKMQAIAAITQLLKLFGIVCPSALQECLRQYEARGRFSRWELLSRIFKDTNGSLSDN